MGLVDADWQPELRPSVELMPEVLLRSSGGAEVYRGVWFRTFSKSTSAITVAMKKLTTGVPEVAALERPVHRNILRCYGATTEAPFIAVSEYCAGGSLADALKDAKSLAWPKRVQLLLQVAEALAHVHAEELLVQDITSHHIFLTQPLAKTPTAKLDVDLPRGAGLLQAVGTDELELWRWRAPEATASGSFDRHSDVYCFGMLMFEVLSRTIPYSDVWELKTPEEARCKEIANGRRPNTECVEGGCPQELLSLMRRCWNPQAQRRPTMTELAQHLTEILKSAPVGT